MHEWHPFAALLKWPTVLAAGVAGTALPAPENVVVFLGAIGLGLGIGVGSGYAAFLQRTSKARADAFREMDQAQRESTLAKLSEATRTVESMDGRIRELEAELAAIKRDLDEERKLSDKLREDVVSFALSVLHERGHISQNAPEKTNA